MRQRVLTIHEKYEIWDEKGRPILFVERPGHYLRNLGAIFGGLGRAVQRMRALMDEARNEAAVASQQARSA